MGVVEETGEALGVHSAEGGTHPVDGGVSAQLKGAAFVVEAELSELRGKNHVDAQLLHAPEHPFCEALSSLIKPIEAQERKSGEVVERIGRSLGTQA